MFCVCSWSWWSSGKVCRNLVARRSRCLFNGARVRYLWHLAVQPESWLDFDNLCTWQVCGEANDLVCVTVTEKDAPWLPWLLYWNKGLKLQSRSPRQLFNLNLKIRMPACIYTTWLLWPSTPGGQSAWTFGAALRVSQQQKAPKASLTQNLHYPASLEDKKLPRKSRAAPRTLQFWINFYVQLLSLSYGFIWLQNAIKIAPEAPPSGSLAAEVPQVPGDLWWLERLRW